MAAPTTGRDHAKCEPTVTWETGLGRYVCEIHGGRYSFRTNYCQTVDVLLDVKAERARQFAAYGTNADIEDGTGEGWLYPFTGAGAAFIQEALRQEYEQYKEGHGGKPTWTRLVREEVAESFIETDPARLRAELLQVAALAVSWIEKIDARGGA